MDLFYFDFQYFLEESVKLKKSFKLKTYAQNLNLYYAVSRRSVWY